MSPCNALRISVSTADHYYFINDDESKEVSLDYKDYRYQSVSDPISGKSLNLGESIHLDAYSGRWLRFEK